MTILTHSDRLRKQLEQDLIDEDTAIEEATVFRTRIAETVIDLEREDAQLRLYVQRAEVLSADELVRELREKQAERVRSMVVAHDKPRSFLDWLLGR